MRWPAASLVPGYVYSYTTQLGGTADMSITPSRTALRSVLRLDWRRASGYLVAAGGN